MYTTMDINNIRIQTVCTFKCTSTSTSKYLYKKHTFTKFDISSSKINFIWHAVNNCSSKHLLYICKIKNEIRVSVNNIPPVAAPHKCHCISNKIQQIKVLYYFFTKIYTKQGSIHNFGRSFNIVSEILK